MGEIYIQHYNIYHVWSPDGVMARVFDSQLLGAVFSPDCPQVSFRPSCLISLYIG